MKPTDVRRVMSGPLKPPPKVYVPTAMMRRMPRKANGDLWNARMFEVYRCLKHFSYSQFELSLFDKEIDAAVEAKRRADNYLEGRKR